VIDYSVLKFAKQRPKALDKQAKAKAIEAKDKAENAKARKRAAGRCEVRTNDLVRLQLARCPNKDSQTHHLIGGIGRRNRGKSILAEHKLRVCNDCHKAITGNVLQPTTDTDEAAKIRYRRVR
jgi:hypothetical protein